MSGCGGNIGIGVPGPQGPPGPTGPTGPGGGGTGGGNNVSIIGNVSGAPALISSGTLFLAGGNNVTLSQNGQSITISANTAAAANLSVSGGSTSGAFGGLTFSNANNQSFGLNNGTITGSVNAPGLGTTFVGANVSGSMTLNTAGFNLSLSAPNESGIGLSALGSSQSAGTLVLSNSNGLSFGMNGSTVTASYNSTQFAGTGTTFSGTNVSGSMTLNSAGLSLALSGAAGGSGASTGGIYAAGNTTGQSSSSTYAQSSLNLSLAGLISGGWSSNTFVISAPGTTGLTQLSAGMSTAGNTAGNTGLASAQLVLVGSNNITLSGSTNGGSATISFIGGAGGGGGGGVAFGVSTAGNTAGATGTVSTGNVVLVGSGPISLSQATGGAGSAATITINAPATSSLVGTNGISISNNGSTISVSQISPIVFLTGNTTGQSSSSSYAPQSLVVSGAGGASVGWSGSTLIVSGGAGGQTTQTQPAGNIAGVGTTFNGANVSGSMTLNSVGLNLSLSAGAGGGATTGGIYAAGNTTGQSSNSTYPNSSLNISLAGVLSGGWSSNSFIISSPGTTGLTQLSAGMSTGGNTAGTTGLASAQLVLAGGNNITLSGSTNAGSMTISIAGGAGGGGLSGGVSTGGNTAGNTGTYSGQIVFAGGNNITLSVSSGAAGAQTITISGGGAGAGSVNFSAGTTSGNLGSVVLSNSNGVSFGLNGSTITASANGVTTVGLYALGNTTQNSSTTLNQSALSFNGIGALTVGYSNSSIQLSAPAVSSISGTGQVSVSVNGSTISIGVPALQTLSYGFNPYENQVVALNQVGQASLLIDPEILPNMQFDRIVLPIYNTNTTLSSGSHSLSFYVGVYSRNASTLSLVGSTSGSTAVTQSGTNGSYSLYSGLRNFTIGSTATLTSGKYWLAFGSRTSSAGADGSYSNLGLAAGNTLLLPVGASLSFGGGFGASVNATNQLTLGQGYYSASTTGVPSSIAFSQINGTASNAAMQQIIMFASSTV